MNSNEFYFFGGFILFIILVLFLDLGIFRKKDRVVSAKEAGAWTLVWILLALSFYFCVLHFGNRIHGVFSLEALEKIKTDYRQPFAIVAGNLEQSLANYRKELGLEYITGYILEESLSVDNIFVIILIFTAFGIQEKYYHKVLFWGILGALVFRFLFIFTGAFLIAKFGWILYIFAAFLIFTGFRMLFSRDSEEKIDTKNHPIIRLASRFFAVWPDFAGSLFFVKKDGRRYITPLFLVLLIVEFTDLVFAVDSIPAIFAVTTDPYIVFFSNIFAIMGLRSIFFVLQSLVGKFRFFKTGLSIILVYIGLKMLLEEQLAEWGFTIVHSLLVIVSILTASTVASFLFPVQKAE